MSIQEKLRLTILQKAILQNCCPKIQNCSWMAERDKWSWGDLEKLGWASRNYITDRDGNVEFIERHYTGPNNIYLQTGERLELIVSNQFITGC